MNPVINVALLVAVLAVTAVVTFVSYQEGKRVGRRDRVGSSNPFANSIKAAYDAAADLRLARDYAGTLHEVPQRHAAIDDILSAGTRYREGVEAGRKAALNEIAAEIRCSASPNGAHAYLLTTDDQARPAVVCANCADAQFVEPRYDRTPSRRPGVARDPL